MSSSALQLTREPLPGLQVVLCIPGTYCAPDVFTLLDERLFPALSFVPISWMTSPGPWNIPALGRRVATLLHELNAGPAIIIGHSTGGAIALAAALADPSLIAGMLLADTGANTHGHGDITSIIKLIEQGAGSDTLNLLLRRSFYHQPDPVLSERLSSYAASAPREAALEVLRSQATLDLAPALSGITMPVMLLHGRYDQARPVAHAELLHRSLPHAELRLVETGHTPMVEDIPAYTQALQRLCAMIGEVHP